MKNKLPRIVIVTTYGHPMAINLWIKYYEKYFMDEVDEVYIFAAGNKNNFHDGLIESNKKLCELVNKKHNNSKLNFEYFHHQKGDTHSLTTHAHLLQEGTLYVKDIHEDASVMYVDDDLFVHKRGYVDSMFKKIESEGYNAAARTIYVPWICGIPTAEKFDSTYPRFLNLKNVLFFINDFNKVVEPHLDRFHVNDIENYKSGLGNYFGNFKIPPNIKFDLIDLELTCDESSLGDEGEALYDEILLMEGQYHTRYFGKDKIYQINDFPLTLEPKTFVEKDLNSDNLDGLKNYVDQFLIDNKTIYHFGGMYRTESFIYKQYSIKDIHNFHDDGDVYIYKNINAFTCWKCWMEAWDWPADQININETYHKMVTFYNNVMNFDDLPSELDEKIINILSNVILSRI